MQRFLEELTHCLFLSALLQYESSHVLDICEHFSALPLSISASALHNLNGLLFLARSCHYSIQDMRGAI